MLRLSSNLRLCAPVLRLPSVRVAAAVPTAMVRALPRVSVSAPVRWMSSKEQKADGGLTKEQLIAQFPVKWPWGQNIEVDNGKMKFKVQIPQDRPGARQHKLIFTPDVVPPVAPDVPLRFTGVAGNATHTAFDAALKAGSIDETLKQLDMLAKAYEDDSEIEDSILNPRTSEQDKLKYVRDLASSMGCNAIVTECVVELQTEMRLRKIGEVSRNFRELVQEHRKEVEGAVVSAEPLSDAQFSAIVAKMQKLTASGEKLIVKRQVDPDLIGGFVIRVGDRVQDLSVAAQIARMQKHLSTFFASNPAAVDKVLKA